MLTKTTLGAAFAAAFLASVPTAALAELPEPIRAMIDAAVNTGDQQKLDTVLELARKLYPQDIAQIDGIAAQLREQEAQRAANEAAVRTANEEAQREQEVRTAGLFDDWSGRVELGGFNSTGNSPNTGITAVLNLTREGERWRHNVRARADYQRSNDVTTRERFLVAYEPNLKLSDSLFAYALGQYERDRFQGFSARYSLSGGLGYQIIDSDAVQLSAKAGPAYRATNFTDGSSESSIAALVGLDFDWAITDRLKLTQDTNAVAEAGGSAVAFIGGRNTSINLVTGLNAKLSSKLSARLSYAVEHDTNPPEGAVNTDTQSRVTIVYDF